MMLLNSYRLGITYRIAIWCTYSQIVLSTLHPRLFRGVTPDRHAGEASLAVVHNWLAHSGYPLDLDIVLQGIPGPLRHMCHIPYC